MDHRGRVLGALSGGVAVAAAGLPPVIALGALAATPFGSSALATGVVAALIAASHRLRRAWVKQDRSFRA